MLRNTPSEYGKPEGIDDHEDFRTMSKSLTYIYKLAPILFHLDFVAEVRVTGWYE